MKGERRSTTKITLRLRPSVVDDLKELAERWDVALADVVATGVSMARSAPFIGQTTALEMKQARIDETGHRAFPRKKKKSKR